MAWFKRSERQDEAAAPVTARAALPPEAALATRAFPKFLNAVSQRDSPVIVDFGPVIGSNVSFFGERLGCKIFVEDLFADVERHARANTRGQLSHFFETRLSQDEASVDGVLCWDLFDFLDRAAAVALAAKVARMVRPGGAAFAYFGAGAAELTHYSKYFIQSETALRVRTYPATPVRRNVLQNRDIGKMFEPLNVNESFLLKTNMRETLFRRP
ncbi:MAG: hypothetical protein WD690_04105 [Vicinamibacterales bacterium]